MVEYVLRRILLAIPTILLVMFMTFMLLRLVPGSLVEIMLATVVLAVVMYFRHAMSEIGARLEPEQLLQNKLNSLLKKKKKNDN